jgi:ribonucleoside-triphosphate reductase (thioredoxin)
LYNEYWSEHSISITVYVKEHEWLKVGAWVYQNFDKLNGVSFLPHSEHIYKQAPYESIDEEEFIRCSEEMPKIDWNAFNVKEYEDVTAGIKEFACTAGGCEMV